MAKWKCNDTACLHQWTEKDPTCCPQCGSTDFQQISGPPIPWKIIGLIIVGLIVLILMSKCNSCVDNSITATITFKENTGTIKVELDIDNKDKKDFVIELQKGASVHEIAEGVKTKTFNGLMPGSYYVNVKYIGEKKGADKPNIIYDKTKGPYTIIDPPPPPPTPTIVRVVPVPNKSTLKYTLIVKIKPDSLTKLCEFSIDGSSFTQSNVFNNVPAGTYNITARLIDDNSIQDTYPSLILTPIDNTPPKPIDLQGLLNKISNGDDNSFNQLSKLLPTGNISVTGAGGSISTLYALMVDCNSGNRYIVDPKVINKETTTINARKE